MAFPAYSQDVEIKDEPQPKLENADWLCCSSFVPFGDLLGAAAEKKPKHKSKRTKRHREEKIASSPNYCIDTTPVPVPQVSCSRSAPSSQSHTTQDEAKKKKKKPRRVKPKRYFTEGIQAEENKLDPEEYLRLTKEFNILLREQPRDIDSWCKYVQHQDQGEGTRNGIASKKLSIVDKALEHNPTSEVLLSMKLQLMEELYAYDKVVSEAKILASKHSSSTVGWRWLISSTQFNLTRLTAPGLINHFGAMLEDANKRGGQPKFILDVLLEVGLFLRHAGLWELLWTLIEQYLEICFTVVGSGAFKVSVSLPEQEIEKIEDGIMTSGLPLHALWMRTEHLRSCVHFLPTTDETGDHQRIVLPEDVAPLMYPVTSELATRLSSIALTLLKIPPLFCTEAFVSFLGLKNIPWHLESSEILLTAILPPGVSKFDETYLHDVKELLVPPQYLKDNLGREPFYNAVDKIFDLIAQHCSEDRINFLIWKMRWYRFCIKTKKIQGVEAKPILTKAKNILKKERTALPIYSEYALLEESTGNITSALKVLETAIQLQQPGLLASKKDQLPIFAMYRVYVEFLLRNQPDNFKEKIFRMLIAMAFGEKLESVSQVNNELVLKALERFDHVTTEMISSVDAEGPPNLEDILIGPANLHWFACHCWFYFTQKGKLPAHFDRQFNFSEAPILMEGLVQLKIDVLGKMKETGCSGFDNKSFMDLVTDACSQYPNNTTFLHTLSSIKFDGVRWGKISSSLVQTGSPIAVMFFILLSKNRLFSGDVKHTGSVVKMFSILSKCTETKKLERCPMLWRLILQYVSCTLDEDVVEKEYHKAVEKCPWVKILYYEAANQLPKLLADIQDLLTEKELRIHVTPEELEILREPAPPEEPKGEEVDRLAEEKGLERNSDVEEEDDSFSSDSDDESSEAESADDDAPAVSDIPLPPDEHLIERTKPELVNVENLSADDDYSPVKKSKWDDDVEPAAASSPPTISSEADDNEDAVHTKWDEEKRKIAKRLWEAKRRAKLQQEEMNVEDNDRDEPIVRSEMNKLEEEQTAKIVPDTCADDPTRIEYDDAKWNSDRLKTIRTAWESKRNK